MNDYIALLERCDIATILVIVLSFYFYDKRIQKRFDKIDEKFDAKFDKVDARFDKLDDDVKDIDRRLCRIEGSMSSKDCCMLKDDRQMKKAE